MHNAGTDGRRGVILFGHGARDRRWAEPFERLAQRVERMRGHDGPVALAFLELMTPDLPTAIATQVAAGCRSITVVPIFFGIGAHLRRDFPALIARCQAEHPGVSIDSAAPVGEDEAVLGAIGDYVLRVAP